MGEKLQRDSNIELLRIVMMLSVVFLHAISCSGIMEDPSLKEFAVANSARGFLMTAVNCFVLISGYYGINFKLKGLFKLYSISFFYGLVGYLIHLIVDGQHVGFSIIYNSLLCISHYKPCQWFVVSYFLLYMLSPFINVIVNNIKRDAFCLLLVCMTIICVYFAYMWRIGFIVSNGLSVLQLVYMYLIGCFIGKYIPKERVKLHRGGVFFVCVFSLILWMVLCVIDFKHKIPFWYPNNYNNPVLIVCSVSIFLLFTTFAFSSKIVNKLAKGTYAVYVIHSGPYVWGYFERLFKSIGNYMTENEYSVFIYLAVILLVSMFVMFLLLQVDKIRELIMKPVWQIYPKIESKMLSFSSKLFKNNE